MKIEMKLLTIGMLVVCLAGAACAKEGEKSAAGFRVGPFLSLLKSSDDSTFDGGYGGGVKLSLLGQNFGVETSLLYLTGSDSAIKSISAWEMGIIGALPLDRWTPYAVIGFGAYKPEDVGDSGLNEQSGMGYYLGAGGLMPFAKSWELFGEVKYVSIYEDENSTKTVHRDGDYNTTYYTPAGPAGFDFTGVGVNLGVLLKF